MDSAKVNRSPPHAKNMIILLYIVALFNRQLPFRQKSTTIRAKNGFMGDFFAMLMGKEKQN